MKKIEKGIVVVEDVSLFKEPLKSKQYQIKIFKISFFVLRKIQLAIFIKVLYLIQANELFN